ncbi:hypothetical protein FLP10_12005 [Agromyces intestinalis]|uniref:Uncharacterized protein n=1 Tax=Agromyces intestinalis TaxID=2592652 RepID=A0A5C1YHH3_9MICO|nr:DUF5996 family protein [Agromyces intestinalis]QEO15058.1 hypothetical protein FLP10_12005 [Agromyces intestinalis]
MDADVAAWPALRVDDWTATRETLHLWLQVVGKVELASTVLVNHWWNVAYEVSARGLRTRLMHALDRPFDAEFDFVDQVLVLRTGDGSTETIALRPRSVADFFAHVTQACARLGVPCTISARPNEVSPAIPFAEDTSDRAYDASAAHTFWQQLLRVERVFARWRAGFAGKASPVQLFWGSMDLSSTRFSGRLAPPPRVAPPNCPPWVMEEAESRENAAAGFWAGRAHRFAGERVDPVDPLRVLAWSECAFADQVSVAVDDGELGQCRAAFEVVVVGAGAIGLEVSARVGPGTPVQDHSTTHRLPPSYLRFLQLPTVAYVHSLRVLHWSFSAGEIVSFRAVRRGNCEYKVVTL